MRISDWSSDVCSSDLLGSNDQQFASVLEVHRYPVADHGLDLSDAPVRLLGMAHAHAGRQMQGIVQGCLLRHQAREVGRAARSEEHTSELQSLMRISYAVFCLKKKKKITEYSDS